MFDSKVVKSESEIIFSLDKPTQCAKDCGPYNRACQYGRVFTHISHNVYFNACALIFFKLIWLKNWVKQLSMQTKSWQQYFWLWRPQSLTHTVDLWRLSRKKSDSHTFSWFWNEACSTLLLTPSSKEDDDQLVFFFVGCD